MFFYFDGVSKCEQKYLSWFWKFGKTFGNMFRVVRADPVFKFLKVKQFTGFFIVSVHPKL